MKKVMKNVLLTCVAASALVIAMATTAMAAETITYDKTGGLDVTYADGKVSVNTDLSTQTGQVTVLVLDKDAVDTAVTADKILYIDQAAAGANIFQNMGLKNGALTAGTYKVKVGGTSIGDSIKVCTITVSDSGQVRIIPGDIIKYTGDVIEDSVNTDDVIALVNFIVDGSIDTTFPQDTDEEIQAALDYILAAGDVVKTDGATTIDTAINTDDAVDIVNFIVGNDSKTAAAWEAAGLV